jgi:lipooligosaccharide transport system ATP-binding protein
MIQSDMSVIKTSFLSKRFGSLLAVDHIDLEIAHGECFGLLGPNGAGKTTLIKMITGVTPPTEGHIEVLGYDLQKNLRQAKARLGVVPQHDNLDPDLKVGTNLTTFARYFDIPSVEARRRSREVLKFFELEEKNSSRVDELSGGMKRRLLIARSLINNPSLIVLDEPTSGLEFREMGGRINVFNLENEVSVSSLLRDPQKLRRRPANLEDVFMKLTGRSLED